MSAISNLEEYDTLVINDLSLNGDFLTNFQVSIPVGTILPWQDINTIPNGWKLCDGNGTYTDISGITRQIPDLRSKFIIGHDTRDTSFNIDTSGSSFVYRESDSDPHEPRSLFMLADSNDDPLESRDLYKNIYYSLAYIICVSNSNIATNTSGYKVINGNLICNGDASLNGNVNIEGNVILNGYISSDGFNFPSGQDTHFRINGTNEMTLDSNGNLIIGANTDTTDTGDIIKFEVGSQNDGRFQFITRKRDGGSSRQYKFRWMNKNGRYWDMAHNHEDNINLSHLYFKHNNSSKGYVDVTHYQQDYTQMNFTGQHRTFIQNISASQIEDYVGLIVSANQNTYITMSNQKTPVYGKNAITINECLPKVSLSIKDGDKRVFGVISGKEDVNENGERLDSYGNFVSIFEATYGDKRTYINSVGEGAIWVSNKNGNLESGDYIMSSSIPGYGQKQDNDSLKNYTVAKITMDCDFQPSLQYIKKIKTNHISFTVIDNSNNYYHATTNELIYTKPLHNNTSQSIDVYKNIKYNLTLDASNNLVSVTQNSLDEHGDIQWEDTTEEEYAYDIRYLDANSNIITKEQYDTAISNGELVYIAAFVGCTYHCG